MPGCACAGKGDRQTEVTHRIPRDIKGCKDRKGSALGVTVPQKKITSSLPASSVLASGVVGNEGAGEAGGSAVPPNLKASGGVAPGAGLGAGKQGSGRELRGYRNVRSHHKWRAALTASGRAHLGQVQMRGRQAGRDSVSGGFGRHSHPCL